MKVTVDTGVFPLREVEDICRKHSFEIAYVSVTQREASGCDYEVELKPLTQLPEMGVWNEGKWGQMRWASENSSTTLEDILRIISSGSFPVSRSQLAEGQKHQLRDALILEAHINAQRDMFVSNDKKAYINHEKRGLLEASYDLKILTKDEFITKFQE